MTAAAPVLNLNNEVVKMRKDVKKVKALTIRKLIRHMSKLKAKKGTEETVLKNQRRAQRLLEEIQCIKKLKPDDVTKTALRKEINFNKVFNRAKSTVETRAVTRLATHPLLKQKISAIKEAINAFKEARMNQTEDDETPKQPPVPSKPAKSEKKEAESKPKQGQAKQKRKMEETKLEINITANAVVDPANKEMNLPDSDHSIEEPSPPTTPQTLALQAIPEFPAEKNILLSSSVKEAIQNKPENEQNIPKKDIVQNKPENNNEQNIPDKDTKPNKPEKKTEQNIPKKDIVQNKPEKKSEQNTPKKVIVLESKAEKIIGQSSPDQKEPIENKSDSSDLEDSDSEVKEYFDDSTEERFIKQGSGFEDSDDSDSEDDFFIGKVRRIKKKKSSNNVDKVKKDKVPPASMKPSVSGKEEQKVSTGPKNVKLESVFCTSLAEAKQKSSHIKRDSKFPPVRNKKPDFPQANIVSRRPPPVKQTSKLQETLHPSWEASKKRKAQCQIAVFQGKKIVFDD
ncbi:serum response factor-binding protein 1 [Leptodactylus fuscus]|uniref:serum response factor-binding protein 1 n=1 Tax=Leptodactylus fuscus TaxID=238119 RepID=UPI003F4ED6AE